MPFQRAAEKPLDVQPKRVRSRMVVLLLCAGSCWAGAPHAAGLWDPGFANGGWRSDYADATIGTVQSPLQLEATCAYPGIDFALCPSAFRPLPGVPVPPRAFTRSNWHDQVTDAAGRFWVVGANTEPSAHDLCNSGPPNQSESIGPPFEGVYGLDIGPASTGARPHRRELTLALDLRHHWSTLPSRPGCQTVDFIPYLGFGAASERGAGGTPLAWLSADAADPVLQFSARLLASDAAIFSAAEPLPAAPKGQHAGLLIEANWNDHRRWVWIELFNSYQRVEQTIFTPWNWALPQSFHFPGAEIVVTSGAALRQRCPAEAWQLPDTAPAAWVDGSFIPVRLNLGALYRCVGALYSDSFAQASAAALTGVHFWNEVGVRDIDAVPGLSEGDFHSTLAMAFSDVDLVPQGLPVLDDPGSFIDQLASDLLSRNAGEQERTRWLELLERDGEPAVVQQMLELPEMQRIAGKALRLQLLGWGEAADRPRFLRHVRALGQARLGRQVANEIVRDPRFARRWPNLRHSDTIYRMLLAAESGRLDGGSAGDPQALRVEAERWQRRLMSGKAAAEDLLLECVQRSGSAAAWNREVVVILLYSGLTRRLPGGAELADWRVHPGLPHSLIEHLLWSADFRNRFLPDDWRQR